MNPISLAVGAVGGATFAMSGAWWVLPLTGVAWGVLSATQLKGQGAPPPKSNLPTPYALRFMSLQAMAKRIEDTLASSDATIRSCLADVPPSLAEMLTKVEALLARQARIEAYLGEVHPQVAAAELARLEASHASAASEDAKRSWATAIENKRAELDARGALHGASDRIAAELAAIEAALGTTLSKIVSLEQGGVSAEAQAGITGDVSDVLIKVSALEQALDETSGAGASATTWGGRS